MKMKKTLTLLAVTLGFSASAQQDIHFSQFYASPLQLNPATAGMFEGDIRVNCLYRTQWPSITAPFTTMAAAIDAPFFQRQV